ncbi:MAG: hypothetical protein RMN25_06985 [Anaerolineae bacterium]|nr:hypothetical protein [Thermoflexales bacterium]MDW8407514.1 hypothetical protein [Anaerolineae bacterium]
MRILILILIVLGVMLIAIGLYSIIRARIAAAQERARVLRNDPTIIEGRARVIERSKDDSASTDDASNDSS